ncbi:MAG: enoyl-CoA hydratase, partial [Moorea sp. SIO3G5]|nr:enoyl-CoA hydratase [Moorena sp. SIO3G5]
MANVNLNLDLVKGNSDVVQLVELGNGVVQITMKDEENCNRFSPGIIEGLYKCFGAVAENKSYKVVILTGYGNYFCSGGTKEELISIYKREIKFSDLDFFRIALDCEIPVIAAMQGHSIGGGLVFGLYADLVVLSQESIYTTNFMKYGFTPGLGCTLIVPEKLGVLGWEMMYTAQN